jgi:signal transduction histidine kinase
MSDEAVPSEGVPTSPQRLTNSGIQKKLIRHTRRVLYQTTTAFILVGIGLILYQSSQRYTLIKKNTLENLYSKGKTYVSKDSKAISTMAANYELLTIREVISSTLRENKEVISGIYMDNNRRLFAAGVSIEGPRVLNDPISRWAAAVVTPADTLIHQDSCDIIEFAAPVFSEGMRVGTLRYTLSTRQLVDIIKAGKHGMIQSITLFPILLTLFGGIVFLMESIAARRQAYEITKPLQELTTASRTIALGDYNKPLSIITADDEIGALSVQFEKMRHTIKNYRENLEHMVNDRTAKLEVAHKELVEKALRAGMADIASGTLHNVGNLLNSVKASVQVIEKTLNDSTIERSLKSANDYARFREQPALAVDGLNSAHVDVQSFCYQLEKALEQEHSRLSRHAKRLAEFVSFIEKAIADQQRYAGASQVMESINLMEVLEEALVLNATIISRAGVEIIRDFSDHPEIHLSKMKILHVCINIIKNAVEAMDGNDSMTKKLKLSVTAADMYVSIKITDTGSGIIRDHLSSIFAAHFSTKKQGHGFGLHSSAIYVKEMGGEIWAESDGPGKGSTFIIRFAV